MSLRNILDENTDKWGVKIEAVEIREVDPARKVKDSMEEQTSAERKRRAAILEADGQKRAAILEAEGRKKSMILQAEGQRQSMILEAEGKRLATILEGQGEAQRLRIMSVGASAMDSKALSVLSMQTIQKVGEGDSSKIFFPMELTRLVDGISDYMGSASRIPDREVSDTESIAKAVGNPDEILGPIPSYEEIKEEKECFDRSLDEEMDDVDRVIDKKSE